MAKSWIETHTFHHADFSDLERLSEMKRKQGLSVSLCFPTLNAENTIAKEIIVMKSELMSRHGLVDEIVVVDSGSNDHTLEIAAEYGARTFRADDILPSLEKFRGKGENLWKALFVTGGDIIVFIDADIKNIHPRFVYALLGPLIQHQHIKFTKAFYDRSIVLGKNRILPSGGGRVTELVVRPLFSLFFPELTQILQPLSGEYAGFREIFENIPFPISYGVETSMILDIYKHWGLNAIAQVDLDRRVHTHQDNRALGKMAFVILRTFFDRIEKMERIQLTRALFYDMIQYDHAGKSYEPDIFSIKMSERPPMTRIPEYRHRTGGGKKET